MIFIDESFLLHKNGVGLSTFLNFEVLDFEIEAPNYNKFE